VFNITYGENFVQTILKSEKIFRDKHNWNILVQNAMRSDFSWNKSVERYQQMYEETVNKKRHDLLFKP
jgi:starch synthase